MQCIKTITIQPFRITVNRSSMEEMLFVIKCDCYFIFGKGLRVVRQINNRHIDILSNIDVTNDTNYLRFSQQFNNKETFLQLFKASYNLETPRNKYYFELFEKFDFSISWQKGGYCFEILK